MYWIIWFVITSIILSRGVLICTWMDIRIYLEWFFFCRNMTRFYFVLLLDFYRLSFFFSVSLIRLRVIIFRERYIGSEKFVKRFTLLVIIFVLSIYLLIISPNLVRILLGWDGLGLSSYLLVIYYSNRKSFNSGMITALSNRVGDLLILFLIGVRVINFSHDYLFFSIFSNKYSLYFLILARITKSAQIPFSAWLPAAIAAPTPVSALVHSSTLVTAGVYVLIRHETIFFRKSSLLYLFYLGVITRILARLSALKESDLKKIVALSTLRQLGLIIMLLGIGSFKVRFLHLLVHAFFKALIFISTGNIIHMSNRGQDMRFIGIISCRASRSKRIILLRRLRLIGIPFISAFFSKEILIESLFVEKISRFDFLVFWIRIMLTCVYSVRFIVMYYGNSIKISSIVWILDGSASTYFRIRLLSVPGVLGGRFLRDIILVERVNFSLNSWIFFMLILVLVLFIGSLRAIYNFIAWNLINKQIFWFYIWGMSVFRVTRGRALARIIGRHFLKLFDKGSLSGYLHIIKSSWNVILKNSRFRRWMYILLIWGLVALFYYLNNKIKKLEK